MAVAVWFENLPTPSVPGELLGCPLDTSIWLCHTQGSWPNPHVPVYLLSVGGFFLSHSVWWDFHTLGSHRHFLKLWNKDPQVATQLGEDLAQGY